MRWVSKIVENRIRDNLGKLHADKRDIRKEIPLNNTSATQDTFAGISEPVDSTTPSLILSKGEGLNKLEKAISGLKPEYREVIILTRLEGLSHKQVGEKLGKSPDAVRMLLARAMSVLSRNFENTE